MIRQFESKFTIRFKIFPSLLIHLGESKWIESVRALFYITFIFIKIFLNSQHMWMKGSHLKNYELFNKLCIRRKLTYFDGTLKIKKLSKNKSFGRFSLWILYICGPRVEIQKVHLRPLKLLIMKFHLLSSDKVDLEVLKIRLKILWSHKFWQIWAIKGGERTKLTYDYPRIRTYPWR